MESIGEFFRQVRETKGLTLDEVASKTRIHPDFLKALEEGNFAKLPDQVFAKGFVRSYARSLGLDEEDAMRCFVESAGTFYNKQGELERLRVQQAEDERRKKANRKVVVAATGVALLALILLLSREQSSVSPNRSVPEPEVPPVAVPAAPPKAARPEVDREPAEKPIPAPERRTVSPPGGPEPRVAAPGSEAVGLPPPQTEPVPLSAPSTGEGASLPLEAAVSSNVPLVLDLEALELSWVVVQVDNGSPHEALLRQGERIRWKASEKFTLTLGNAGGVRVELNGKVHGPFGPKGKVARDIVLKRE